MLIKKQTHLLFPLFNDTAYYLLYVYVLYYSKEEINLELAGKWTVIWRLRKKMCPPLEPHVGSC